MIKILFWPNPSKEKLWLFYVFYTKLPMKYIFLYIPIQGWLVAITFHGITGKFINFVSSNFYLEFITIMCSAWSNQMPPSPGWLVENHIMYTKTKTKTKIGDRFLPPPRLMMFYVNVWWTCCQLVTWFTTELSFGMMDSWLLVILRWKRRKFPAVFIVMSAESDMPSNYFSCSDISALSQSPGSFSFLSQPQEFKSLTLSRFPSFSTFNKWFSQSKIGKLLKAILNRNCLLKMNNYLLEQF